MKVTYNWIRDFVDIKISPQELADKLTMAGLEVTSLEEKKGDFVFEIEITSNRPDWLSVKGIAREVSAITGIKMKLDSKLPVIGSHKNLRPGNDKLTITIEDTKDCSLYTARVIKDVKVGPSPDWLSKRLELVGCRSVNNIVDITNYCLFEYGEPLHAFDLDKLNPGEIIVRRAKLNEKIVTLDAVSRVMNPEVLVIADKARPVAIAGVMGGKDTEVTASTKNILLEAAVFNQILIRRGRSIMGLQSESAYRFERGINPEMLDCASLRAATLINELAAGKCVISKSSGKIASINKKVILSQATINQSLGLSLEVSKSKKILNSLGFKIKTKAKQVLSVEIPSHRQDVNSDVDLIEEVARIYGYENIPTTLPAVAPQEVLVQKRDLVGLVKNIITGLGLNEVITYSLIDKQLLATFGQKALDTAREIMNPLSAEQEILRTALTPSLVRCVAANLNQKQEYVNVFEIAKTFSMDKQDEELVLGVALSGMHAQFLEQGVTKDPVGMLHLKGILEVLFERLGIQGYIFIKTSSDLSIKVSINKEEIGSIIRIEKNILDKLDIKNTNVFTLEVSLDKLFSHASLKKKFIPLPKYPGITRDVSFILKYDVSVKDVLIAIEEKGRPLLYSAKVVDYYKGKQIPSGYRGLTVSCFYRSQERTLTEAEINPVHTLVCDLLRQKFSAQIR